MPALAPAIDRSLETSELISYLERFILAGRFMKATLGVDHELHRDWLTLHLSDQKPDGEPPLAVCDLNAGHTTARVYVGDLVRG